MSPRQTALGRLLQDRRESGGYSRTRLGELLGVKPGTIEGWELGRVARPPIHDVLRVAHFLQISADDIQRAVFDDAGDVPSAKEHPGEKERKRAARRARTPVPLLEAAFRLFGWSDESDAADALGTSEERVRAWRLGEEQMSFAEYLTLTSMIGIAAAEAIRGDDARIADLSAAAEELGLSPEPSRAPRAEVAVAEGGTRTGRGQTDKPRSRA
jgi:transcriptional regulator with XRE-family HTH domain